VHIYIYVCVCMYVCTKNCFNNNQMLDKNIPWVHYFDTHVYSFFSVWCLMWIFSKRKYTIISLFKWFFFISFLYINIHFGFYFLTNNKTKSFQKDLIIPCYWWCVHFGFEQISFILNHIILCIIFIYLITF